MHFEGADYGRRVCYRIYRYGRCVSFNRWVIDGWGNGAYPSDTEIVLKYLINMAGIHFPTENNEVVIALECLLAHLSAARKAAREQSDSIIYGYEGT